MSLFRRLTTYGALNLLHGLVVTATTAVAAGLLFRALGEEFGLLALITGGMLRLNLVDDSLGALVVTLVSGRAAGEAAAAGDPAAAAGDPAPARLVLAGRLYALAGVVFGAAFAAAVAVLLRGRGDVAALALTAGGGLLVATLANLLAKLAEGEESYLGLRSLQSATAVLRLAAVAALVAAGVAELLPFVVVYAASLLVLLVALAVLTRRDLRRIAGRTALARRTPPGELAATARFMRPLLVAKAASIASYRLDLWIVQGIAGTAATAAYALAEALAGFAAQSLEVLKALLPVSVREWRRDPAWVEALATGTTKLALLVVGGVAVVAAAAAEPILLLWFGEAPALSVLAARLLLLFYALTSFRATVQIVMTGQGLFGHLERHFLVGAALNVVGSVAATWAFGGWGAALGTVLAGIYLLVANLRQAERSLGLAPGTLFRRVVAPGVACLALAAGAAALPAAPAALAAVVRGGAAAAVFLLAFWLLVLRADERTKLVAAGLGRGVGGAFR